MARKKTVKITDEMKKQIALNAVEKLDVKVEKIKDSSLSIIEPVIDPNIPKPEIITGQVKIYKIYTKLYNPEQFPVDQIEILHPDVGSYTAIYELKTYISEKPRWMCVALYQLLCDGWQLISQRPEDIYH